MEFLIGLLLQLMFWVLIISATIIFLSAIIAVNDTLQLLSIGGFLVSAGVLIIILMIEGVIPWFVTAMIGSGVLMLLVIVLIVIAVN